MRFLIDLRALKASPPTCAPDAGTETYIFVIEKVLASAAPRGHMEVFKAALAGMRRLVATLVYHRTNCTRFDREKLSRSDGPTSNSNSFSNLRNHQTPAKTPQTTPFIGGKKGPAIIDGRAESVWGSEAAKHRASFRRQREGCRRLFAAKSSPQIQIAKDHVGQIWCRVFLLRVISWMMVATVELISAAHIPTASASHHGSNSRSVRTPLLATLR
ncbi:hypothetical protein ACVIW0_001563 [Bradyrhizobium sp. USDA 4454]